MIDSYLNGIPEIGKGRKLVIVAPSIPNPFRGASTVLFYWYISGLKAAGFRILNILLLDDSPDPTELEEYRRVLEEPGRFEIMTVVSARSIHAGVFSLQIDPVMQASVTRACALFNPDMLFCLDLRCAWSAMASAAPEKIAWLGDLSFETGWYHALYARREGLKSWWTLPFALLRSQYWKKPYCTALASFSQVIVASKSSESVLRKVGIDASYLPYPWPAEPPQGNCQVDKPTLLFFGNFEALGSRSSFYMLIREIYPELVSVYGSNGFCIKVCGRGRLTDWVESAIRERPEFEMLGFVQSLSSVIATCHAMIVPVEVPVGNRSRILTALSQRLLVIAHANTALGNPDLKDGENCYLANTAVEFIDRIRKAIADTVATDRIAERGFVLYEERFSPANAVKLLLERMSQPH